MDDVRPTQARFSMPHDILLLPFQIYKKPKGIGMSWKVNIIGNNQLRSNWIARVTAMEEKEAFWI